MILSGCGRAVLSEKQPKTKAKVESVTRAKAVYYVSPHGSDKANGRSIDAAWRTLNHAIEKTGAGGGEIRVLPGTYSEHLEIDKAGRRRPLKIIGFKGRPVMEGRKRLAIGFWLTNSKNVTVENFEFRNFTDIGIGADSCKNITFRNLIIHNNGFKVQLKDWELEGYGIHIDGIKGYLIEGNKVYRNGPRPKDWPDRILGTGIDTFGSRDGIIRNNKSYENIGGGILVEDSRDIIVEKNEVYKNDLDATRDYWWDGGIWLDGGKNVVIRDNNFHDNIGPGILISDEDKQKPSGYVLKNNISKNNYFGVYIWNFGVNHWPKKSIIYQLNNDFTGNKVQNIIIHAWDYDPKTLKVGNIF